MPTKSDTKTNTNVKTKVGTRVKPGAMKAEPAEANTENGEFIGYIKNYRERLAAEEKLEQEQLRKAKEEKAAQEIIDQLKTPEEKKKEAAERAKRKEAFKRRVFALEAENYNSIIVYQNGKPGWYSIGGHSALIFKFRVAKRINRNTTIRSDRDFCYKFKEGVINIRNIEKLEEELKTVKIFRNIDRSEPEELYVFDLGYSETKDSLERMLHDKEIKKEKINKMVLPKNVFPEINAKSIRLMKLMTPRLEKMTGADLEYYGKPMMGSLLSIRDNLQAVEERGEVAAIGAFGYIMASIVTLKTDLYFLMEMEKWSVDNGLLAMESLVKLGTLVNKEWRKYQEGAQAAVREVVGS